MDVVKELKQLMNALNTLAICVEIVEGINVDEDEGEIIGYDNEELYYELIDKIVELRDEACAEVDNCEYDNAIEYLKIAKRMHKLCNYLDSCKK